MKELNSVTGIITYRNEKEFLKNSIDNIYPHVNQLILCDDQSLDNSYNIAISYPDPDKKILNIKIPLTISQVAGFGDKKNFSMVFVKNNWTLILDADEIIEDQFYKELPDMINDKKVEAYGLPRKNYINGIQTKIYPDHQIRLTRSYCRYILPVHEQIVGYEHKNRLYLTGSGYHIIHKKSSQRQIVQINHYKNIKNNYKQFLKDY